MNEQTQVTVTDQAGNEFVVLFETVADAAEWAAGRAQAELDGTVDDYDAQHHAHVISAIQ